MESCNSPGNHMGPAWIDDVCQQQWDAQPHDVVSNVKNPCGSHLSPSCTVYRIYRDSCLTFTQSGCGANSLIRSIRLDTGWNRTGIRISKEFIRLIRMTIFGPEIQFKRQQKYCAQKGLLDLWQRIAFWTNELLNEQYFACFKTQLVNWSNWIVPQEMSTPTNSL